MSITKTFLFKILLVTTIIGLVLFLFTYFKKNDIQTINTGSAIKNDVLSDLQKNTLVIFDIDNVLLVHEDPFERGFKKERSQSNSITTFFNKGSYIEKHIDRPTRDSLWSIYINNRKEIPVDSAIYDLIKELQQKQIRVIGLTHFLVGPVGKISSIEDVRINALKNYGISFDKAFPNNQLIEFKHCNHEGKFPLFKDGILFTSLACSKGELLTTFFKKIGWQPVMVIMVDDKRKNLESVQSALKEIGVKFKGFEYTGAAALPAYFSKEVAEFQVQHLIDTEQWLSGAEAQETLKQMGKN